MRTLIIESEPGAAGEVTRSLESDGHQVLRCHHDGAPSFPCNGLTGDGCPLEAQGAVDVAIAVHPGGKETARESGATCAARKGIPLVVVSYDDQPFGPWAEVCRDVDRLDLAVERAMGMSASRRAAPLVLEARRVLVAEGVDAGDVWVDVKRDGDAAKIVVWTERTLDERVANTVATRVHAVDQTGSWPTTKVAVAIACLD